MVVVVVFEDIAAVVVVVVAERREREFFIRQMRSEIKVQHSPWPRPETESILIPSLPPAGHNKTGHFLVPKRIKLLWENVDRRKFDSYWREKKERNEKGDTERWSE